MCIRDRDKAGNVTTSEVVEKDSATKFTGGLLGAVLNPASYMPGAIGKAAKKLPGTNL